MQSYGQSQTEKAEGGDASTGEPPPGPHASTRVIDAVPDHYEDDGDDQDIDIGRVQHYPTLKVIVTPLKYFGKHYASMAVVLLCLLVRDALALFSPFLMGQLLSKATSLATLNAQEQRTFLGPLCSLSPFGCGNVVEECYTIVFAIGTVQVLMASFEALNKYLHHNVLEHFKASLRRVIITRTLGNPFPFFQKMAPGGLSNVVNDAAHVTADVYSWRIPYTISAGLQLLVAMLLLSSHSPGIALVYFIVLFAIVYLQQLGDVKECMYEDLAYKGGMKVMSVVGEAFTHAKAVKSLAAERSIARLVMSIHKGATEVAIKGHRWEMLSSCACLVGQQLALVAVLVFCINEVISGTFPATQLLSFILYAPQLSWAFHEVNINIAQIKRYLPQFRQIVFLLESPEEDSKGPETWTPNAPCTLQLEQVSFVFPSGKRALRNISFCLEPGKMTAVVGPSGAGKSTLASILLGLYTPTAGSIKIAGRRYSDCNVVALRRTALGYVDQEPVIFTATVRQNLLLGNPNPATTEEDIWRALRQAAAEDFTKALPNQLDTRLGVGGINLSGGQKQRLIIARALLRKPRVMILDEATSSLDGMSEALVTAAIDRLVDNRTPRKHCRTFPNGIACGCTPSGNRPASR